MPVGVGTVVAVLPIVATTSLWNLLIAYLSLEHREKLNVRTALGTLADSRGTIVSHSAGKVLNDLDTIRLEDVSITKCFNLPIQGEYDVVFSYA